MVAIWMGDEVNEFEMDLLPVLCDKLNSIAELRSLLVKVVDHTTVDKLLTIKELSFTSIC